MWRGPTAGSNDTGMRQAAARRRDDGGGASTAPRTAGLDDGRDAEQAGPPSPRAHEEEGSDVEDLCFDVRFG